MNESDSNSTCTWIMNGDRGVHPNAKCAHLSTKRIE